MKACNQPNQTDQTITPKRPTSEHWREFNNKNTTPENLPWIGSYFDIPIPENEPSEYIEAKLVLQVLMKDLSVKEYTLTIKEEKKHFPYPNIEFAHRLFRGLAYHDEKAMALMDYSWLKDATTGQEKNTTTYYPSIRKGISIWQEFDHYGDCGEIEREFSTRKFLEL